WIVWVPSAHQHHRLPTVPVFLYVATRASLGGGHALHAKLKACLRQPERRRPVTGPAVVHPARNSQHVTSKPVPPIPDLPELAFLLLLWRLRGRAFCEQRKAGLWVPDQVEIAGRQ